MDFFLLLDMLMYIFMVFGFLFSFDLIFIMDRLVDGLSGVGGFVGFCWICWFFLDIFFVLK